MTLFKTIKNVLLTIVTTAGLLMSGASFAEGNAGNGNKLYSGSQCNKCHGTEVFTRKDRKVKDLKGLEAQVRRCDSNLNTNWFDDEIHDVTAHLNKKFYKFK